MTTQRWRVTIQHLRGLAASSSMRGGRTILALTDDGLRFVSANSVFASGSTVRRLLMVREDLLESAAFTKLTVSAYLTRYGRQVAAELNDILAGR